MSRLGENECLQVPHSVTGQLASPGGNSLSFAGMSQELTDFTRIRMLWPDHLGIARGKYVPGRLAHKGSAFCVTTFAMAYDRDLIPAPGAFMLEGLKDVHGSVEVDTLRGSWENEHTGVAVADITMHGEPYEVSARTALQGTLTDWSELGYSVKVGIELEGYLLQPDGDGGWERYQNPRSYVYGTGALGDPTGFVDEVMLTAERCGFTIESANVEFDESQFEFTLEYDDAMRAVDDTFLFRVMVRELAIARGLDFTFLGKPFTELSGSGVHVNFSLVDADGSPALADDSNEHGISQLGLHCIGGLMKHHQALTALSAPIVNSYRRLQPGSLSGCWANWGVDHRNVTNRIPAEGGSAMRIESRVGDGAMNLHLGVAAVLQAARLGVVNQIDPGGPYEGDGFEDGGEGVERCADSLSGALDHLEADTDFSEAVGGLLVDNFIANKRHEVERFEATGESIQSEALTAFELAQHLPYH